VGPRLGRRYAGGGSQRRIEAELEGSRREAPPVLPCRFSTVHLPRVPGGRGSTNEAIAVTTVNLQNTGEQTRTTEPDGTASLEKVRDLLFGVQMRDYDRKFARLEERLMQETSELREDVKKRLAAIEQLLSREVESLNERVRAEHDDRTTAAANLSRQLDESGRSFEKRTAQIDDQLARNMRELRQQIHEQHQQLSDDLKRQADEILTRLARESQELRTDKTDRASLAALLTEMAMRLTDDFRLPPSADAEARG